MHDLAIVGIPVPFFLFGATLLGIALLHRHTLAVALGGLLAVVVYRLAVAGFSDGPGLAGLGAHMRHEWVTMANLFCLLTGFALLARHFEKTRLPVILPRWLADDWVGGFQLLVMIFVLSSFLDNIAAALIGGAMAHALYSGRVHVAFLAAIVAAANAGGAGSVIGDTTTTMMWLSGVSPLAVLEAYIAAGVALVIFGIPAARTQQAYSPIVKDAHAHTHVDGPRLVIVAAVLSAAIATNLLVNLRDPAAAGMFPWIGTAVWLVLLLSAVVRRPDWEVLPEAVKGSVFLLSLVLTASLMPVEALPAPGWLQTLALGFVSAVFDNIPLTALALAQGGYDWGFISFAVGFGGSMIWFGSSAGVALSNLFPQARSVGAWLRHGWPVIVGYVAGYLVLLLVLGWHPV